LGLLLRLYVDALLKGNPLVVALTVVAAVAVSAGPFYKGLSSGDPAAIGIVALILAGILLLLTVAIIDRRINGPRGKGKRRPAARSGGR
jgi:hypothetical protein